MINLELMKKRFEYQGGVAQEDRMIMDKYRTFLKSLKYSYQGADIQLAQKWSECLPVGPTEHLATSTVRALINPDKVKQDYDDKILSLDYKYGIGPGDVFYWVGTQTYWLINLEELTEDAYFRGEIRRCRYKINFLDSEGNRVSTWAAIRGPVETQIDSLQKNQIRVHRANLSLNILMPRNEKTVAAFERYKKFLFAGRCWEVQAPNAISTKNILEIAAEESYIDTTTDDVENEIKNGLVIEPEDPTPGSEIKGETFIIPMTDFTYTTEADGEWNVCWEHGELPVVLKNQTPTSVTLEWTAKGSSRNRPFTLTHTSGAFKQIVVDSLF